MKRSRHIHLVLMGGLSAGALAGCGQPPAVTTDNSYTNNYYVPGVGYYHAPFREWYPLPYNSFNKDKAMYFYGGQWGREPFESITNISSPTAGAAAFAQVQRTDVVRGGFGGGYYGGHYYGGSYHSGGFG